LEVEEKLRPTKRAALYFAYEEAAEDEEFMKRMNSITRDFAPVEADGL
jgi:hypothetical protein